MILSTAHFTRTLDGSKSEVCITTVVFAPMTHGGLLLRMLIEMEETMSKFFGLRNPGGWMVKTYEHSYFIDLMITNLKSRNTSIKFWEYNFLAAQAAQ